MEGKREGDGVHDRVTLQGATLAIMHLVPVSILIKLYSDNHYGTITEHFAMIENFV